MAEDENTVYTTSQKNRVQSGGMGPDKTNMQQVTLQVAVPARWDEQKIMTTIQQAVVEEMEIEEGQ